MSDDAKPNPFSMLSDADLKRIAAENPPSDPHERAGLVTEMHRRAGTIRAASIQPMQLPKVIVADVDMPFGSMVTFMVKWAIASIPALIILLLIGFVIGTFLAALGLGLGS